MDEVKTELIDQAPLAKSVSDNIKYAFKDKFLVKPLEPIKIKKEISKPIVTDNTAVKDENGVEAVDYKDVETKIEEVDSNFRRGVVLKVPYAYSLRMEDEKWPEFPINIGDVIIYNDSASRWFDLLKDTVLIDTYSIFAKEDTVNADK